MNSMSADDLDRQRRRWRRARKPLGMVDPTGDQFGLGGLGGRVAGLTFRMVILPTDPFAHQIDFDEGFWKAWMTLKEPGSDRPLSWSMSKCPTSAAAVRCSPKPSGGWSEFLALDHAGMLDIGCGRETGFHAEPGDAGDRRAGSQFFLLPILDRMLVGSEVFAMFAKQLNLSPPFEVSVALCRTDGACLGRFARGWQEPEHGFPDERSICHEPNVMLRREILAASEEWPRSLAESLALQVDNAFESATGRFRPAR